MKRIEKLIPTAIDIVKENLTVPDDKTKVPKSYKGYISSFGASMLQAGILPTIAFYSDEDADSIESRPALMNSIFTLLKNSKRINTKEESLLAYAIENMNNKAVVKRNILDAAIAVKLALRTFKNVDVKK